MTEKFKVLETFTPKLTKFNNKEEFLKYLDIHKMDLKDTSTYKMNKMFSIPGYRITKIKGEIGLMTAHYIPKDERGGNKDINTLSNGVKIEDLKLLDNKINYIIEILKENSLINDE
ncbi:hypothetical protein FACS189472_14540 [Alphaproteobacteria bacterium]|nr:hypothetical protein FACS189472_14540 [Alphaproteobacteria bacterium]